LSHKCFVSTAFQRLCFLFFLWLPSPSPSSCSPAPCPDTPDRFSAPPWTLSRIPTHHVHITVARPVTEHLSDHRKITANLVFSSF
jgi:hypothetical protein